MSRSLSVLPVWGFGLSPKDTAALDPMDMIRTDMDASKGEFIGFLRKFLKLGNTPRVFQDDISSGDGFFHRKTVSFAILD